MQIALGYGHFNNVNSPNPVTQCIFPLVLEFSEYRPFASVGRFISRHFIILDVTVFLIPTSNTLLLVYRTATDFCILLLYSVS